MDNTIISFGLGSQAVHVEPGSSCDLLCCDVFGNQGGDWVGHIAGQYGAGTGNLCADPLFCDPMAPDLRIDADSPCAQGDCGLIGAWPVGCGDQAGLPGTQAARDDGRPRLRLTPNPFRSEARIICDLPVARDGAAMEFAVLDISGRLVRSLGAGRTTTVDGHAVWDGRDDSGRPVGGGMYVCRVVIDGQRLLRPLLLLR